MNMKDMLLVLGELKSNKYFYKSNCLLSYDIPQDGEVFSGESARKVEAILDLHNLGAIRIHNKGEERIPGSSIFYEFQILIIQPSFDGIYQRYVKEVTGKSLEEYEKQIETKKNMPALIIKLNQFIEINRIIGKQKHFLQLLNDFEPKLMGVLKTEIGTENIKYLKKDVQKRIRGSGFGIKTLHSKSINKTGTYQLILIPPVKN